MAKLQFRYQNGQPAREESGALRRSLHFQAPVRPPPNARHQSVGIRWKYKPDQQ